MLIQVNVAHRPQDLPYGDSVRTTVPVIPVKAEIGPAELKWLYQDKLTFSRVSVSACTYFKNDDQ